MKINSRLAILGSLVLGYLGILMPGTYVQYQALADTTAAQITSQPSSEGAISVFSGKEVSAVLPCQLGAFDWQNELQKIGFLIWQYVGVAISMSSWTFWYRYAEQHKMPGPLFLALGVLMIVGPAVWVLVFHRTPEPICEPISHFKVLTFSPYWLTVMLWCSSIGLGYWANQQRVQPTKQEGRQSA